MSFNIEITAQAQADLKDICNYIAISLEAPQAAAVQLANIEKAIMALADMPKRFAKCKKEPWHGRGLRVMPVNNYGVFYAVDKSTETVTILRIMYGGKNIDDVLNNMA